MEQINLNFEKKGLEPEVKELMETRGYDERTAREVLDITRRARAREIKEMKEHPDEAMDRKHPELR